VSANIVNVVGNYVLMYGHWGLSGLGAEGSGYSTSIARFYMAGVLLAAVAWRERQAILRISWRWNAERIRRLAGLGIPAAMQMLVEGRGVRAGDGVRGAPGRGVARGSWHCGERDLDTYMVPLGISSAAAVRVGQGGGEERPARRGGGGMVGGGAEHALHGRGGGGAVGGSEVDRGDLHTRPGGDPHRRDAAADRRVLRAVRGFQTVATGALRGLGDTRTPCGALRRLLAGGAAAGIRTVFFRFDGRERPVGRAIGGADIDWDGVAGVWRRRIGGLT